MALYLEQPLLIIRVVIGFFIIVIIVIAARVIGFVIILSDLVRIAIRQFDFANEAMLFVPGHPEPDTMRPVHDRKTLEPILGRLPL